MHSKFMLFRNFFNVLAKLTKKNEKNLARSVLIFCDMVKFFYDMLLYPKFYSIEILFSNISKNYTNTF